MHSLVNYRLAPRNQETKLKNGHHDDALFSLHRDEGGRLLTGNSLVPEQDPPRVIFLKAQWEGVPHQAFLGQNGWDWDITEAQPEEPIRRNAIQIPTTLSTSTPVQRMQKQKKKKKTDHHQAKGIPSKSMKYEEHWRWVGRY